MKHCFLIHQHRLLVDAEPASIALLQKLWPQIPAGDCSEATLRLKIVREPFQLPSRRWTVPDFGIGEASFANGSFFVEFSVAHAKVTACYDIAESSLLLFLDADTPLSFGISSLLRLFLHRFAFRFAGLQSIHGALVSDGPTTALIVGPSRAGKTTLALALRAHGFQIISDDLPFLSETKEGVIGLAPPEELRIGAGTLKLMPQLTDSIIHWCPQVKKWTIGRISVSGARTPQRTTAISSILMLQPETTERVSEYSRDGATKTILRAEMLPLPAGISPPRACVEERMRAFLLLTRMVKEARVFKAGRRGLTSAAEDAAAVFRS